MARLVDGSTHRLWYENPDVWAEEQDARVEEECSFLTELFNKHKVSSVLDVGCGVGSHCQELSKQGFKVTGVDINDTLVAFAKKRYPELTFIAGDQKTYNLEKTFDAIYSLCTVIAYATTNKELVQTLKNHHQHLKKDGLLVLNTFNPIVFINKEEYLLEKQTKPNKHGFYTKREFSVDYNKQLSIDKATFYDAKTHKIISTDKSVKRMTFPQEMKYFLEQTGFKVLTMNTNFDKKHTILDGHHMTIVAQKK